MRVPVPAYPVVYTVRVTCLPAGADARDTVVADGAPRGSHVAPSALRRDRSAIMSSILTSARGGRGGRTPPSRAHPPFRDRSRCAGRGRRSGRHQLVISSRIFVTPASTNSRTFACCARRAVHRGWVSDEVAFTGVPEGVPRAFPLCIDRRGVPRVLVRGSHRALRSRRARARAELGALREGLGGMRPARDCSWSRDLRALARPSSCARRARQLCGLA